VTGGGTSPAAPMMIPFQFSNGQSPSDGTSTGSIVGSSGTALEPVWVVTIRNHHSYVNHFVCRSKPGHFTLTEWFVSHATWEDNLNDIATTHLTSVLFDQHVRRRSIIACQYRNIGRQTLDSSIHTTDFSLDQRQRLSNCAQSLERSFTYNDCVPSRDLDYRKISRISFLTTPTHPP
jgi:hypothetical protein